MITIEISSDFGGTYTPQDKLDFMQFVLDKLSEKYPHLRDELRVRIVMNADYYASNDSEITSGEYLEIESWLEHEAFDQWLDA